MRDFHNKSQVISSLGATHHIRQAWPQQVTLTLNVLDERVDKGGVGLRFRLSISEELDAVLAHFITSLQVKVQKTFLTAAE